MKLKHDQNVLVIPGGWNANILLDGDWVKRYLFPDSEDVQVNASFGIGTPGPPHVSTGTVRMSVAGGKLCFAPLGPETSLLDDIEELAGKLADYLPHTPVKAMGINFVFEAESTDCDVNWTSEDGIARLKSVADVKEELHRYSFPLGNCTLNLIIQKTSDGKQKYDLNFHHEVESLSEFKGLIADRHIVQYKADAEVIVSGLLDDVSAGGEQS